MTLEEFKKVAEREGIDFDGFCAKLTRFSFPELPKSDEMELVKKFLAITDRLTLAESRIVARVMDIAGRSMFQTGWDVGVVAAGGDLKKVKALERRRTKRAIARIEKEQLARSAARSALCKK
jgi:hypothetical protein